ncbi:MAG: cytochrome c-type biogenesis protein CcmH [Rubrivivax sp.]|nr:cytochrome c-type biogenesis protein CcmH [Rubrivivax sp.]
MHKFLLALLALCLAGAVHAVDAPLTAAEPELEKQMLRISAELRCLVCQNQTIADSNAELAVDLRNQVRDMLRSGQSERQIIDYMTARYGDFVLYRPPVKGTTFLLWFGPAVLMVVGLATLVLVLRRRSRLGNEHFDPEEPEDIAAAARPLDPKR